jgi:ABC-type amino acid transport system permease subunit
MVPATVSQLITLNKDTTLISIIAIPEVIGAGGSIISASAFGNVVQAPYLQVYLMIGFFFFVVNFALSRLSRRLEIRERERTGTTLKRVKGLEDQVAAETDLTRR